MNLRLPAVAVISAAVFLLPAGIAGQAPADVSRTARNALATKPATTWSSTRLADGRPDLIGYWSKYTATTFERSQAFTEWEFITDDEVSLLEREPSERTMSSIL